MTYKLLLGDCLEVMKEIEDKSIDAIITDLPYGTTACKWDVIIPFEPMWKEVKRVLKSNGVFITTSSQPFTSALVMSNPKMFKYEWVWDKVVKRGHLVSKIRPLQQTEGVLVFGKGKINYYPQETKREKPLKIKEGSKTSIMGKPGSSDYRNIRTTFLPSNLIVFSNGNDRYKIHSTQKPVALYEYLIKTYTNERETVLDICMGSGTTIEAAENIGRNSIGIEKDESIFQIAVSRLNKIEIE